MLYNCIRCKIKKSVLYVNAHALLHHNAAYALVFFQSYFFILCKLVCQLQNNYFFYPPPLLVLFLKCRPANKAEAKSSKERKNKTKVNLGFAD